MARAAESVAAPELQTLFDSDWSSGKYRRPKCSKSDFYAGWLTAYERFKIVAPADKVTVVEIAPAAAAARTDKPTRKAGKAKAAVKDATGIVEQSMVTCPGVKVPVCSRSTDRAATHERQCGKDTTAHRMVPDCASDDEHNKLVTRYSGGLPLKRQVPKGPAPFAGDKWNKQAIPDSLIRKLAIMAGRPEIAP